ncbi:PfkB family carbohydrate kinase [Georgenia phoenicis]|uniref:PfkB family carbohydrate kinase n=1 Tax=Georgenia sp. 1P07AB TaxID=554105 RepID=UPI0039AF3690
MAEPGPVDFLVVGESLVDIVDDAAEEPDTHPGGGPMNVAYGLGLLARTVILVTELGDDAHGAVVRDHLATANVMVPDVSCEHGTSRAWATVDSSGSASYAFDIRWELRGVPVIGAPQHVHVGSVAAFVEPGAAAVREVVERFRGSSTVSFDPNVRPALLGAREEARERAEWLVSRSDVVKASDEDLRWLYPDDEALAVARRWLGRGPALVVVTKGHEGVVAVTGHGAVEVAAVPATVADTVGAGDSFMSALLDGLSAARLLGVGGRARLRDRSPEGVRAVLERAARAAAITVARPGAHPPDLAELGGLVAERSV